MHMQPTIPEPPQNIAETPAKQRVCNDCGRVLDMRHFRRVRAGDDSLRHSHCDDCKKERERVRRLKRRCRRVAGLLGRLEDAKTLKTITATLRVLMRECRGLRGFAEMLEVLMNETAPTSPTRRKILLATTTLIGAKEELESRVAAAERAARQQEFGAMSDDELSSWLRHQTVMQMRADTELRAGVLGALQEEAAAV